MATVHPRDSTSERRTSTKAKVEIYTWRFCPYCIRAKGLLDRKGVTYNEYIIDGDDMARKEMTKRSQGGQSVPQIFINNRPIGGCDELHILEESGDLDALLDLRY